MEILIKTALISVYNKINIDNIVKKLANLDVKIISTGGTKEYIENLGIEVTSVESLTNYPSLFNGRVKTLHPSIMGGILFNRDNENDINEANQYQIPQIDLVIVDLYPFENTLKQTKNTEEIIEKIDIGGISLIRAAAKNFKHVLVIPSENDYPFLINIIEKKNGISSLDDRKQMATRAFEICTYYDRIIFQYFRNSPYINIPTSPIKNLRYGENPHQKSALYKFATKGQNLVNAEKLQGKELSYNNYLDLDSALNIVKNFSNPACVIIKHNNPCGVAEANTLLDAYKKALSCDPVSAFGGILAFNYEVDEHTAEEIIKLFTECIIAPGYTEKAKNVFAKKKDLRLLVLSDLLNSKTEEVEFRQIDGGMLVQTKDLVLYNELVPVTKRHPTEQELKSLIFAFKVAKYVKSNTIVLAKRTQTVGIGAGQMSRIDALKIAEIKMNQIDKETLESLKEYPLVLASDAFFPFRDVVEESAKIGVSAIIQPGGSLRDEDSINAANENNIAMVFTKTRHFRH